MPIAMYVARVQNGGVTTITTMTAIGIVGRYGINKKLYEVQIVQVTALGHRSISCCFLIQN